MRRGRSRTRSERVVRVPRSLLVMVLLLFVVVAVPIAAADEPRLGRFVGVIDGLAEVDRVVFADGRTAYAKFDGPLSILKMTFSDDADAMPRVEAMSEAAAREVGAPEALWRDVDDWWGIPQLGGQFPPVAEVRDSVVGALELDRYGNTLHRSHPVSGRTSKIGGWGAFPGLMAHPSGMDVVDGLVYIADTGNHRVQVFDGRGERLPYLYEWGLHVVRPHEDEGHLHYPADVAVSPDGVWAIVTEPMQDRLQVFGVVREGDDAAVAEPMFERETIAHFGTRAARDGVLMVTVEPDRPGVIVWDLSRTLPIMIGQIVGEGWKHGGFHAISDVAIRVDGPRGLPRVWTLDAASQRVQVFDLNWSAEKELGFDPFLARFVKSFAVRMTLREREPGMFNGRVEAMALRREGGDGGLVLHDAVRGALIVADARLRLIRTIELGQAWKRGVLIAAVPGRDEVAALHPEMGALLFVRLDDGEVVRQRVLLDDAGAGYCEESGVVPILPTRFTGLMFDAEDAQRIWVTDGRSHRVLSYDLGADSVLGELAVAPDRVLGLVDGVVPGHPRDRLGAGLFHKPGGLLSDQFGNIVVIDRGNHRLQFFGRDGAFQDVYGARWFTVSAKGKAVGRTLNKAGAQR